MDPEFERLQQAFMEADAAGDTESASALASALRSYKKAPEAAAIPEPSPANPEMKSMLAPRKQSLGEKFLVGSSRLRTGTVKPEEFVKLGETAIRSATAPIGGDFVAAGSENIVRFVTGQPINKSALRQQRERRQALAKDAPILAGASEAASLTAAGANLVARAPQLAIVPAAQGGTRVGNAARVASEAAIVTGVGETLKTSDVGEGLKAAGTGALVAPAVGKALSTVVDAGGTVPKYLSALVGRPSAAAYQAIAKRMKMSADDLQAAADNFRAITGRAPKPAKLLDVNTMKEFVPIVRTRDDASRLFAESYEQSLQEIAETLPQAIRGTRVPLDTVQQTTAAQEAFTDVMADIGGQPIRVAPVMRFLENPAVMRVLPRGERGIVMEMLEAMQPGTNAVTPNARVPLATMETIRKALRDASKDPANADKVAAKEAYEAIRDHMTRSNPTYARVFDDFAQIMRRVEGQQFGRGKAQTTPPAELRTQRQLPRDNASQTARTPETRREAATRARGISEGFTDDLANTAGESANSATRVLDDIQAPNTQQRIETVSGPNEAGRLRNLAETEVGGARNEATLVQRAREEEFPGRTTRLASASVPLAIGRFSGGFAASKAVDALLIANNLRIPPGAARRMAEIITDNDEVAFQRFVAELRRIGRTDEQIANAIQAAVAPNAGAAVTPEQDQSAFTDPENVDTGN